MFKPGDYCIPNTSLVGINPQWVYKVVKVRTPSLRLQKEYGTQQTIYLAGDGWPRKMETFTKVVPNARTPKI